MNLEIKIKSLHSKCQQGENPDGFSLFSQSSLNNSIAAALRRSQISGHMIILNALILALFVGLVVCAMITGIITTISGLRMR
jgi:hypothetical protein